MFIRGEILQGPATFGFTISGERGAWTIRITPPDGPTTADETTETRPWGLFQELITAAVEAERRKRMAGRPEVPQ